MKQPLLLLHGAISSRKQFDVLLPFLSDRFEVHTFNFQGHGGSETPGDPFSIPLFASSVLRYLDEKKISATSIFGYSMGGYVALYLAAHHPVRVSKIFTLATKLEWTPQIAERETKQLNAEKIAEKVPAFAATLEKIHLPQDWKKVLEKTSAMLLGLGKQPVLTEKDFRQIEAPAIIGIGEMDKMVSVEESENAARHLKNGKLLVLPATQHPFEKINHEMLAGHVNNFFL
jgi:pimeloyl-ACP methyl ester carboxylesterase